MRAVSVTANPTLRTVFIGPSGIGKSVLVNRFAQRSADAGDVVLDAVRVAKRSDPVAHLAAVVRAAADQGHDVNPHLTVRDAMIHLGETLAHDNVGREQPRALLIRIDELQNADETQRSALLTAIGDLLEYRGTIAPAPGTTVRRHLPVLVYVTGLPDLLNRATNVDTFRRRFSTNKLTLFDDAEIVDTLVTFPLPDHVTVTHEAARRMADLVGGDPYLFQYVGHAAWEAGDGSVIDEADIEAADENTYDERLRVVEAASEDVPEGEGAVLDALYAVAGDGDGARSIDVAARLGTASGRCRPLRQSSRGRFAQRRPGWSGTRPHLHPCAEHGGASACCTHLGAR